MAELEHGPAELAGAGEKQPYLGSVRFFKHLFLTILLLLFLVPAVTSVVLGVRVFTLSREQNDLLDQVTVLQDSLASVQADPPAVEDPPVPLGGETVPSEPEPVPAEVPEYTKLYPDFYAPEAAYSSIDTEKVCYLTFDDGPSSRTDEILEVLEREDILATFFVTKQDTEAGRLHLQAAYEAGHTIGMHTSSHNYKLIYASVEAFLADYYELFVWIREVTGEAPTIFRFPGGSINAYNRGIYQEIITEMTRRGFVYFDWNMSSADAASPTPSVKEITANCLSNLSNRTRTVVLMHDIRSLSNTVAALPAVIAGYRENGFTFDRLTAEVKPVIFGYRD